MSVGALFMLFLLHFYSIPSTGGLVWSYDDTWSLSGLFTMLFFLTPLSRDLSLYYYRLPNAEARTFMMMNDHFLLSNDL